MNRLSEIFIKKKTVFFSEGFQRVANWKILNDKPIIECPEWFMLLRFIQWMMCLAGLFTLSSKHHFQNHGVLLLQWRSQIWDHSSHAGGFTVTNTCRFHVWVYLLWSICLSLLSTSPSTTLLLSSTSAADTFTSLTFSSMFVVTSYKQTFTVPATQKNKSIVLSRSSLLGADVVLMKLALCSVLTYILCVQSALLLHCCSARGQWLMIGRPAWHQTTAETQGR